MTHDRDEKKWRLQRQIVLFWVGLTILLFMLLLYFVVSPAVLVWSGKRLELPDARIVITIMVMLIAPVLGIKPTNFVNVLMTVLSKLPEEEEHDAPKGPAE